METRTTDFADYYLRMSSITLLEMTLHFETLMRPSAIVIEGIEFPENVLQFVDRGDDK